MVGGGTLRTRLKKICDINHTFIPEKEKIRITKYYYPLPCYCKQLTQAGAGPSAVSADGEAGATAGGRRNRVDPH
jgi:hypothetical protein